MYNIEWHADDYGMTVKQSKDILKCYYNGSLNGISIMPNSNNLNECMQLLSNATKKIDITIHLNLVEGHCCTNNTNDVSLLTNKDGIFNLSFFSLLLHSFMPGRNEYKNQITIEFSNQIANINKYLNVDSIRLDSHVHYHMIPIVFDSIIDVIKKQNLNIEYIRIPDEPISIYIKNLFKIKNLKLINIAKVLILKLLAYRNKIKYKKIFKDRIPSKIFMGVMLSGHMFLDDVRQLLPSFIKLSQKKKCPLEILFHPGGIYENDEIKNITDSDDYEFLTSINRNLEANTLIHIEKEFL